MSRLGEPFSGDHPFHLRLDGADGDIAAKLVSQWFLPLLEANPMLLGVYTHRDAARPRALLPWSGEFAGKYLTAGAEIWSLTGSLELRAHLDRFVARLAALQADDGYLGPWDRDHELTGTGRNVVINFKDSDFAAEGQTWDAWGHYHLVVGTLTWYELTGSETGRGIAIRIADLFCDLYLATGRRLVDIGDEEMNMAALHGVALAHRTSGDRRHLELAEQLVRELPDGKAGDYLNGAAAGRDFYELPGPRWESLHILQGIAELARLTGKASYEKAVSHHWWSIARTDVHNTGGFSSGEGAVGNPYDPRAIETCCTVAWMALSVDELCATGSSLVADALELSYHNGGRGALSPSGRWSTYNTPMDGVRLSSQRDIVFQSRPGSPELNCCSVNAQRLVGMVARWGIMTSGDDAVVVNYYGRSATSGLTVGGTEVTIAQRTDYPVSGVVEVVVTPATPVELELRLRIPLWSCSTAVTVAGTAQPAPEPGTHLAIRRVWQPGDTVEFSFDMRPWYWAGERECAGRSSVYRGPILLCVDTDFTAGDDPDPVLAVATGGELELEEPDPARPAHVLARHPAVDGGTVTLCDFASAGQHGNWYRSWLRIRDTQSAVFSRHNPFRAWWPEERSR